MIKLTLEYQGETLEACKELAVNEVTAWVKSAIQAAGGKAPNITVHRGPPPGMTDAEVKRMAQEHMKMAGQQTPVMALDDDFTKPKPKPHNAGQM